MTTSIIPSTDLRRDAPCAFIRQLAARWDDGHFICVGLDSDFDRLPVTVRRGRSRSEAPFACNCAIIDRAIIDVARHRPHSPL